MMHKCNALGETGTALQSFRSSLKSTRCKRPPLVTSAD